MRNARGVGWCGLLGLLLVASCGQKEAPGAPGYPDDDAEVPDLDAGDDDSGSDDGGSGQDADAANVADAAGDASAAGDAGVGADGGEISECEGDVLEYRAANAPGHPFSATLAGNHADLVYVVPSGGSSYGSPTAEGLQHVGFDTTGDAGEPEDAVNVGVGTADKTRDPALVAHGAALDLFYTSNEDGPYDLHHKDLTRSTASQPETSNSGRNEFATVASMFGDDVALLYSDEKPQLGKPGAIAFKLHGVAAKQVITEDAGFHASLISFAALGSGNTLRGALGFISDLDTSAGIYYQRLDGSGDPSGDTVTLSDKIGGASNVAVAAGRDGGGAVVYTEVPAGAIHQLRFRTINADGQVNNAVRELTTANQDLLDLALSAYSHGYVIAYRRQGGASGGPASIYLMFVDADGNLSGTRLVRSASSTGRGMQVMVANDGRLIVVWSDTESVTDATTHQTQTELRVRVARLLCAL